MVQIVLNLGPDEILRAFTTVAKNKGFYPLLHEGLKALSCRVGL